VKKIRPYIFWIVCGVLILAELVLIFVFTPTSADGQRSPEQVKTALDDANKELDKLYKQAQKGSPAGREFDAENQTDIKLLTTEWLATPAWKPVLDEHLDQYRAQMGDIRQYLVKRSAPLHEQMSTVRSGRDWYDAYEEKTAKLLKELYDEHCLVMDARSASAAPGAGAPTGGAPTSPASPTGPTAPTGGASAPTGGGDQSDAAPDFREKALRSRAGFFTTTQTPDTELIPKYELHYNLMRLVRDALIGSKGVNDVSPAVRNRQPQEERARLLSADNAESLAPDDKSVVMHLKFQGPISALLAVQAALEENRDAAQPIKAVIGCTLARKSNMAEGERRDATSEPAVLAVTFVVLDFQKMEELRIDPPPEPQKAASPAKPPRAAPTNTGTAAHGGGEEN
jgi:hypothetical protein